MEFRILYFALASSEAQNASFRKREKGFERIIKSLANEVDSQRREIESLRQPKKTYQGMSLLRKTA